MTGLGQAILAATLAGLAALERKAIVQLQLSRPIVVGPLVGWALGDPLGGLFVGAPLELLWIGAANLGAALPPHETAATAAITAGAVGAAGPGADLSGSLAALSFVVFAPVAIVGRRLEGVGERANDRLVERAVAALEAGETDRAIRFHLYGLWRSFAATAALVLVAALGVAPLLSRLEGLLPGRVAAGLEVGWALLWAAGGAAAARAARLPNGLALAAGGAAIAAAILLAAEAF